MSDKILDSAKVCTSMMFEAIIEYDLDAKVKTEFPELRVPLTLLTLGWLVAALDFVMSGEGKISRQHKSFINKVLSTNFSVRDLDDVAASGGASGAPFDTSIVPAFLLLADRVAIGAAEMLCLPLAGLLQTACAWDGERTLEEIARINKIVEPIEQRFGFTFKQVTPADDEFWTSEDNLKASDESAKTSEAVPLGPLAEPSQPKRNPAEAMAELDALVGLDAIKKEVRNISNLARYLIHRKAAGLPAPAFSLHLVFTGNPGTGKTTVARLIGEIYRDVGVLETGHLIEVDRSGLVGIYLGETGPKTREAFTRAKGGVLFIDEAYNLVLSKDRDDEYGKEAIGALLKLMEDHRDDVVVIVAGYTQEMKHFIDSNPGLKSRFTRYLEFGDYNEKDLAEIFFRLCANNKLAIDDNARAKVHDVMQTLFANKSESFGNAREVRTLFEQAMQNQANRLATFGSPSVEQLQELLPEDIT